MYFTDEWRKDLRPTQLMREPFCRECAKAGRRIRATDVDHIVDHKGNWAVFCDRGNLESLCHKLPQPQDGAEMYENRRRSEASSRGSRR